MIVNSSRRSCAGSASRSITTILPPLIVNPNTTRGRPPGAHTASHGPIHERQLGEPGTSGEGAGHSRRAADLGRCARLYGRSIRSEHDVRVEARKQRFESAVRRRRGS